MGKKLSVRELELFKLLVKSSGDQPHDGQVSKNFRWMGSETGREDFRVEKTFKSLVLKSVLEQSGREVFYSQSAAESLAPECLPVEDDPIEMEERENAAEAEEAAYSEPPQPAPRTAPQAPRSDPPLQSPAPQRPRLDYRGHARVRCSHRATIQEAVKFFDKNLILIRKNLLQDRFDTAVVCLIDAGEALDHPKMVQHPYVQQFHARFQSACLLVNSLK